METLAQLSHPNIRQFRHLYEDSHYLYVVMEYIRGESLYEYVERVEKLSERKVSLISIPEKRIHELTPVITSG